MINALFCLSWPWPAQSGPGFVLMVCKHPISLHVNLPSLNARGSSHTSNSNGSPGVKTGCNKAQKSKACLSKIRMLRRMGVFPIVRVLNGQDHFTEIMPSRTWNLHGARLANRGLEVANQPCCTCIRKNKQLVPKAIGGKAMMLNDICIIFSGS